MSHLFCTAVEWHRNQALDKLARGAFPRNSERERGGHAPKVSSQVEITLKLQAGDTDYSPAQDAGPLPRASQRLFYLCFICNILDLLMFKRLVLL